jgi:hypothetical protein
LNDNGRTAADGHTPDVDSNRPASFLRPGFVHFGAPWREKIITKIRNRQTKCQTAPPQVNDGSMRRSTGPVHENESKHD